MFISKYCYTYKNLISIKYVINILFCEQNKMYEGRRGRWYYELKILFGSDFFEHVIYLDTVGCAHSSRLQRVVITDRDLYLFNDNTKEPPAPYCQLAAINNLDIDHNTPQAYRNQREYDPHHISFVVNNELIHIYTFETGTDLYWRLKNSIEFAKRNMDINMSKTKKKPNPPDIDNRKVTVNTYYTRKFNQVSSRVAHSESHRARMQALDELEEISKNYFQTRTIFFQSTTLLTYLIDTLTFFSDFHTVPTQIMSNRLEQIEFISKIYQTISLYLQGTTTVPDATRLITYNKACHFRTLIHSLFQTEFFILSQPKRADFFLKRITDKNKYYNDLQVIENTGVSLCYQLSVLATMTWRTQNCGISRNFFLEVLKEKEEMIVTGGFHTFAYILIQMCYAMQDMPKPLPTVFIHSLYDHIWLVNFFVSKIPSAADLLRAEFLSEFDAIVTVDRMKTMIPQEYHEHLEFIKYVENIRKVLRETKPKRDPYATLPVQFR